MRLHEYGRIVCLCVDHRYESEWPRVRRLVRDKGGEPVCFVDGKGSRLAPNLYDQISPAPPEGWQGSPGSYCHFVAMQAIVRSALADGVESLLFLEDDVVFTDRFDAVVEDACRQARDEGIAWDMLYYGANHQWARTEETSPNLIRVFGSLATHCLGLRRTAFEGILALAPTHPIDVRIAVDLHPVLNCYSLRPSVAVQKPGFSHVVCGFVDYTALFEDEPEPAPAAVDPDVLSWQMIPGWFDYEALYEQVVRDARPGAVLVEVGCWLGRSVAFLGAAARRSSKSIAIFAVEHGMGGATVPAPEGGNVAPQLVGNLARCGLLDQVVPIITSSRRASGLFADGSVDFVFIDAEHTFDCVSDDLDAWWPKIRPGGVLAGHDYTWPEVARAVDYFFGRTELGLRVCPQCWGVVKDAGTR